VLIESPVDENEEQFRTYVTELLTSIYGRMPEWLLFKVGHRFECQGKFFREFVCPAGSVAGQIQLRASQTGGIPRAIILRGTVRGALHCSKICSGIKTDFNCSELRPA
jgi:hypothetical protein